MWQHTSVATLLIDTHRLVTTLKDRGFTEQQASGITEAIQEIDVGGLVTMEYLDHKLTAELAKLKADLFKALVPILLAQSALIVAMVDYFGSR